MEAAGSDGEAAKVPAPGLLEASGDGIDADERAEEVTRATTSGVVSLLEGVWEVRAWAAGGGA